MLQNLRIMRYFPVVTLFIAGSFLASCNKNDKTVPDKPVPVLAIISFPAHAKGGEDIIIKGKGFSSIKEKNEVSINNISAPVKSATDTTLNVTVPIRAGDGKITVKVGDKTVSTTSDMVYDWVWSVSDHAGDNASGTYFGAPDDIVVSPDGKIMYAAVMGSHRIWKIETREDGSVAVNVFAGDGKAESRDGKDTDASFNLPIRLTLDKNGNLYVCDFGSGRIRKITPDGMVSTLKNTITGEIIEIKEVEGIELDNDENLFVAVTDGRIKKITPAGVASDYAVANEVNYFDGPSGICLDNNGELIVACFDSHTIAKVRKNTDGSGQLLPIAGSARMSGRVDGTPGFFYNPYDVATDQHGKIYVADHANNCIREVYSGAGGVYTVSTIAGSLNRETGNANGIGTAARFNLPTALAVSEDGHTLYVADKGNRMIRKMVRQ